MSNDDRGNETTGLLDYVSYTNDYNSTIQRFRPSKREEDLSVVDPVIRRALPLLHSVLILVILAVTFLYALVYFALPIGVHVCLQNECYFSLISRSEDRKASLYDYNAAPSRMDDGAGQWLEAPPAAPQSVADGSCDIPVDSFPYIPVFPANYSIDSIGFCYGQNKTDISSIQACTSVLARIKEDMNYHNVSSKPISKVLLGLSGDLLFYLQIALGMLFSYVSAEWPNCVSHAESVICQYLFPPVIDNNNLILAVNHTMCLETRDDICTEAWKEADKAISSFVAKCNKTYPILNML